MKIISIRHKGLRRFLEKNDPSGLPQDRLERIRRDLDRADGAATLNRPAPCPDGSPPFEGESCRYLCSRHFGELAADILAQGQ